MFGRDLFSPTNFRVENEMSSVRERYGEAFWRAHQHGRGPQGVEPGPDGRGITIS